MASADLADRTIAELAPLVERREVSPVELTEAALARLEATEPRLNAFITRLGDRAREAARAAEREIAGGRYRGPLHGMPISLKDIFDTRGIRTTSGSRILADHVPDRDSAVAERLAAAGTILIGKTNLHEFAYGVTTNNPHYGATRNPWNPERVPGGSSGGSAAAVAVGAGLASMGTDTGASVRLPASFCGIVGLKPTYGRISKYGVLTLAWSLDHPGPMTRCVRDAALMLAATAGPDPRDPCCADEPVADGESRRILAGLDRGARGLRIGLPRAYFFDGAGDEVRRAVEAAVGVLIAQGAETVEVELPHIDLAPRALTAIIAPEASAFHREWLAERPDDYGRDVIERLEGGFLISGVDYVHAQRLRRLVREDFRAAFERVDVVATPTAPVPAFPIGDSSVVLRGETVEARGVATRFTSPFNLTGLPAISVPCGFSDDGLPIGLQLVGAPFDEATVLRAAQAYESATDWHTRRPPLGP
jgi:aspartyl-tRNA(Asn)/glutamyl-tRNA(Gln) amidotransferase subunit A